MKKAEEIVINYMNENGWDEESMKKYSKNMFDYKKRIKEMYLKEIEHIRNMKQRVSFLKKPFMLKLTKEKFKENEFEYRTEEELGIKAINKVNSCFSHIMSN